MNKDLKVKTGVDFAPDTDSSVEEDFADEPTKVRISMFIDGDLLKKVKLEALHKGSKYQTLMQKVLRDHFMKRQEKLASKAELDEVKNRLFLVEKILQVK